MYQPPIQRLERLLKLVVLPAVLTTALVVILSLVWAQEPQHFGVDATLSNTQNIDMIRNFAHSYTGIHTTQAQADQIITDWFSGQVPRQGQCYTLKVVQVSSGKTVNDQYQRKVRMQFVDEPCWVNKMPESECGSGAISCLINKEAKSVACLAGWCVTREEQP